MKRRKDRPPVVEQQTLSRRTVLEWLGAGAALTLAGAAARCSAATLLAPPDTGPSPDGTTSDAATVDARVWPDGPGGDASGYPFAEGDGKHAVYSGWGERTVDAQDIKSILAGWKLTVDGMVETSKVYTFADLVGLGVQDQQTDFHCVEGWSVYDVPWNGVHLSTLSVSKEPKTLLGLGVGGYTLPLGHGFPLRVVIPRLLGYKNAKYIARIELTDKPLYGFWVKAGYGYDAEVPAPRLRPGKY